ncbi:hypothetical protein GUJ93_ZPchr0013g34422 [Zizania palustris]|uniref:Uncharacterized protein n=1 Tax=Zizania palustris TaxID=103762 RepID=A0A8J6C320_ZIZPA|nr:hypothetical protein GUJ93_ZPchr0013g34422 [Zizania palustris]
MPLLSRSLQILPRETTRPIQASVPSKDHSEDPSKDASKDPFEALFRALFGALFGVHSGDLRQIPSGRHYGPEDKISQYHYSTNSHTGDHTPEMMYIYHVCKVACKVA